MNKIERFKISIIDIQFTKNKDLNTRIINALRRSEIDYLDFLIVLYLDGTLYQTLSRIRNLGNKSIHCILDFVCEYVYNEYGV